MRIDCHVHLSALLPGHGEMSPRLLRSPQFWLLAKHFGVPIDPATTDEALERVLVAQLNEATELDAAVLLAFDAVYDLDGRRDDANTHLALDNDYVRMLVGRHPKLLFGASIHPYRRDALEELERCVRGGAVLIKWLPITQGIDPSHPKCFAFYDALAHYGLPLLSHTGGEKMLPNVNHLADPTLLLPAVRRGVTVIAAHCGTRSTFREPDYLPQWCRMALEHERFYGDTAALNLPTRSYAYRTLLKDDRLRAKLVHGSDWPVPPVPPVTRLGPVEALRQIEQPNWLRRDMAIKRKLGLDDAYFDRAATLMCRAKPPAKIV
ncbi:MAG TPA: amidohydrolase family protein [Tepidisphaeraceae bacterium]|jgi:predicted TIM-barrel fold metal-dependent hydrolase